MNIESHETNTKENSLVAGKSNFAQNAFWDAVLGMEVEMTITGLETDWYKIHQVDQYTVIAETIDSHPDMNVGPTGEFVLISKSAIIAVYAPDVAFPQLAANMVEGVKKIKYKASSDRTDRSKDKTKNIGKPFIKPKSFVPRNDQYVDSKPVRDVPVIVKKKKWNG